MLLKVDPLKAPREAYSERLDKLLKQKRMTLKVKYPMIDTFPHGAPLGGFGAGTFARTPSGDFSTWHLFPGIHIYENIQSCNFAVYQKYRDKKQVYALNIDKEKIPYEWQPYPSAKDVVYEALYPRSWYTYKNLPVEVKIEQFSPILPHNYKETSYPSAYFIIQLKNTKKEKVETAVLLSWQNILGWGYTSSEAGRTDCYKFDRKAAANNSNKRMEQYDIKGLVFKGSSQKGLSGQFCIAAKEVIGTKVTFCSIYDGTGDGKEVWDDFSKNGILKDLVSKDVEQKAGAMAVKALLGPEQTIEIPIVITWDIPVSLDYCKYYTKYFGVNGDQAFNIAKELLINYQRNAQKVYAWQNKLLKKKMPAYVKRMLFNELYYLADGGTLWDAATERFTFLECYDYYFYETLDVRYYGAFPLAVLWPEIEKKIMLDFVRTSKVEDSSKIKYNVALNADNEKSLAGDSSSKYIQKDYRKHSNALPHDIGSPFEDVWKKLNAYIWQNSNRWKDLNSKFVLMIYRAYYYDGKRDKEFLKKSWPAIWQALNYMDEVLDKDSDYLPENENFPDQTFDNWVMKGTSAYCGLLKIAALQTAIQIAEILNKYNEGIALRREIKIAKESIMRKIWNGQYFNFDETSDDIMTAQLMGPWYLDQMHLPSVIDKEKKKKVLNYIYEMNFTKYVKGTKGLVNGRSKKGLDVSCSQGNDVWLGVNFAFGAHLLAFGAKRRANKIFKAIHDNIYKKGFLFRTPESWDENDKFIASMYMRPGSIWAVVDQY